MEITRIHLQSKQRLKHIFFKAQRFFIVVTFCLTVFSLQACATKIQTYEPEQLLLPDNFISESGSAIIDKLKWWEAFESEDLNALQEKALASLFEENKRKGNFDLQIAFTRLRQSAAALKMSKTNYFPELSYSGYTSRSFSESKESRNDSVTSAAENTFYAEFDLSYELDLWGKVAAATQADSFRYQATYEDLQTTVLTVSSTIANHYLDLLSTRAELKILEEQVKLNTSMVESQKVRYAFGQATSLDLIQQQEQLLSSEAERPILVEQERALLASLAVLMGELSTSPVQISETNLPSLPTLPQTGVPADLLENRPDIRAAKLKLLASDKDLAVAKLAYFPTITLSATTILSSTEPNLLLSNWATSLISSIAGVLFDAGNKKAEAQALDAATEELAITYIQTVTNALNEVNTALMAEKAQAEYLENLREQYIYQQAAEREAQTRYLFGTESFLVYITQLQNVQDSQRMLITEEAELLKLRVNLYKSLGMQL